MYKLGLLVLLAGLYTTPTLAAKVHASWYGPGFHGKQTASGEIFDQNAMTAAHKTLPFGTWVQVSHNGKSVKVKINDRGPFIKGRTIDLSKGAATVLGCIDAGVCLVDMKVLN
jgi:rare lipoprotein A